MFAFALLHGYSRLIRLLQVVTFLLKINRLTLPGSNSGETPRVSPFVLNHKPKED
jgi:hypothetical protein